jgi:hypothetical protein
MGSNKVTGLAAPTDANDATSKTYVDGILGSATAASASAAAAATSESNAATSETNASNSASAASTSEANAAASYDSFDDRYLGAKSTAPTVDNDGDALIVGALYFNSTSNIMYVYGGAGWQAAGSSVNGTSDRNTYTATAGQTVFAATYDTGYVDVYLNGVKLVAGTDFTATNGTSITLATGAAVNDVVDIVAYGTFVLADHYTEAQSDARFVNVTGDSMTGNLSFGDNDKAIFGAGSDLQIYHDGSDSWISDQGTGDIRVLANRFVVNNSTNSETMIFAVPDGAVTLYNNGSPKLATITTGVDITGGVTADSRYIVQGTSNAGTSDISYGSYANGAWINGLSGSSSYLAVGGNGVLKWDSTGVDITGTLTSDGLTVDGNATVSQNMTNGSSAAFTDPHLALKATNSVDTTGFVGMSFATSDNTNYGFSLGAVRSSGGVGDLVFRNHYNSAQGTKKLNIATNGDISFYEDTGTTPKFFWDASAESLGIGTSSPSFKADIKGGNAATVRFDNDGSQYTQVRWANNGTGKADINWDNTGSIFTIGTVVSSPMAFLTNGTERMRITSSGEIQSTDYIQNSGNTNGYIIRQSASSANTNALFESVTSAGAGRYHFAFRSAAGSGVTSGSIVGSIYTTGSATSYNTSSDYRLKTDAQPMTGASARVQALNPVNFEWIVDGTRVDGFLAHEAQAVVPEAVSGTKDAMRDEEYEVTPAVLDDDGNVVTEAVMGTRSVPEYQGIDQSKLVPLLTAALQEALTKIDAMETRLAALEAE